MHPHRVRLTGPVRDICPTGSHRASGSLNGRDYSVPDYVVGSTIASSRLAHGNTVLPHLTISNWLYAGYLREECAYRGGMTITLLQ